MPPIRRVAVTAAALSALAAGGCSSSSTKHASAPPPTLKSSGASTAKPGSGSSAGTTAASAAVPAGGATLSTDQCLDLAEAQLGVATATKADEARKAADTVEKYGPPADVKSAVEHLVTTVGIQLDDPQAGSATATLKAWVDKVCPT